MSFEKLPLSLTLCEFLIGALGIMFVAACNVYKLKPSRLTINITCFISISYAYMSSLVCLKPQKIVCGQSLPLRNTEMMSIAEK